MVFSLLVLVASCKNHTGNDSPAGNGAYMYFQEISKDAGKIKQGDTLFCTYIVENRGKSDLLIKNVRPSCGCTGARYEQKPIAPKGTGKITLIFATNGKVGKFSKNATVIANTKPETAILSFNCEVIK